MAQEQATPVAGDPPTLHDSMLMASSGDWGDAQHAEAIANWWAVARRGEAMIREIKDSEGKPAPKVWWLVLALHRRACVCITPARRGRPHAPVPAAGVSQGARSVDTGEDHRDEGDRGGRRRVSRIYAGPARRGPSGRRGARAGAGADPGSVRSALLIDRPDLGRTVTAAVPAARACRLDAERAECERLRAELAEQTAGRQRAEQECASLTAQLGEERAEHAATRTDRDAERLRAETAEQQLADERAAHASTREVLRKTEEDAAAAVAAAAARERAALDEAAKYRVSVLRNPTTLRLPSVPPARRARATAAPSLSARPPRTPHTLPPSLRRAAGGRQEGPAPQGRGQAAHRGN